MAKHSDDDQPKFLRTLKEFEHKAEGAFRATLYLAGTVIREEDLTPEVIKARIADGSVEYAPYASVRKAPAAGRPAGDAAGGLTEERLEQLVQRAFEAGLAARDRSAAPPADGKAKLV